MAAKPCGAFLNLRGQQEKLLEEPLRCLKASRGKCRFDFPHKQNKRAEDA